MRVLDLFSGIGGFSIGFERAGMSTVAFCEVDKYAIKVLKKNWPNVPIYGDVRELTKKVLDDDGISVDVICGGFPCQDISNSGRQEGITAERSGLWSEFARLIGEIRPRYSIMENVTALLSGDNGRWFGKLLGDLAEIGYDAEWHCIPASQLGANHHRDRTWIIAYPSSKGLQGRSEIIDTGIKGAIINELAARRFCDFEPLGSIEPTLCRGSNGVSNRSHRIKCLGNAVVPQIPEVIARALMSLQAD